MEVKKIIYDDYNSRVRADQSTMSTLTTNVGSGTLRNGVKIIEQTSVKVKQATHQGYIECELGGGKLELPQLSNPPRASNRERKDLPDSDNGEYP